MTGNVKRAKLIRDSLQVVRREAKRTKDVFTATYFQSRAEELDVALSATIEKAELLSAKNIVSKLAEAVDRLATYQDTTAILYKAAVDDLRDELDAACEGREDYW